MYNLVKERGDGVIYPNYLDEETVRLGLEAGRLFKATFHANVDNIREGHVTLRVVLDERAERQMNDSEVSVLLSGRLDINRAVDGDQVIVELYPKAQWKAESDYLVNNDNPEEEQKDNDNEEEAKQNQKEKENGTQTESSSSRTAEKVTTGRVVAIAKRNWKQYCGSIEPIAEGTINSYVAFRGSRDV